MISLITTEKNSLKLWKTIKTSGILAKNQFKSAIKQAKESNNHLTHILLKNTTEKDEDKILNLLSEHFDMPVVLLRNKIITPQVLSLIPKEIAEEHAVVAFKKVQDEIHVATTAPENRFIVKFIKKSTGYNVKIFITTPNDIRYALKRYNHKDQQGLSYFNGHSEDKDGTAVVEDTAETVPVIRLVDSLIERAIASDASDIHIEPTDGKVIIRVRVDGLLKIIEEMPKSILLSIVARIKILADLKIDEHMIPQDGRFKFSYNDQELALRVSIIPTLNGPKVALRILEMKEKVFTLSKLGFNPIHQAILKKEITSSQGMVLATGPTGSGKTTTLYTLLRMLNSEDVNISTIEDPIEYGIDNINQMQIKPKAGLTFASGLRALLRQDPNVIMVGEIRDLETANIASNSAMTGHLVLSTLHTNSAFLAPQRLNEMGLEQYLVSSVVNLIVGQRLVRKLCPHCRVKLRSQETVIGNFEKDLGLKEVYGKLVKLKLLPMHKDLDSLELYRARGCNKCGQTGYRGRVGIYEVIKVDDKLRQQIISDGSETSLKNYLIKKDTLTMMEDGILKALSGSTTFEEVLRVTKD